MRRLLQGPVDTKREGGSESSSEGAEKDYVWESLQSKEAEVQVNNGVWIWEWLWRERKGLTMSPDFYSAGVLEFLRKTFTVMFTRVALQGP